MSKKHKIILVDDHQIFRQGIKSLIQTEGFGEVIAEAENGLELLKILKSITPDIILLDIAMPQMDGIEATKKILELYPSLKVLVFSSFSDIQYYYKLVDSGAKGFILKNIDILELQMAINKVSNGETYFSNEILMNLIKAKQDKKEEINIFTARELDVINLVCKGLTNTQIAEKLFISIDTVKGHRRNIASKSETHNTAELILYCLKSNIIKI